MGFKKLRLGKKLGLELIDRCPGVLWGMGGGIMIAKRHWGKSAHASILYIAVSESFSFYIK
jgi:hypothetical protein